LGCPIEIFRFLGADEEAAGIVNEIVRARCAGHELG
jgi:hypothetical protein